MRLSCSALVKDQNTPCAGSFKRLLGLMPFDAKIRRDDMRRLKTGLKEPPVFNFLRRTDPGPGLVRLDFKPVTVVQMKSQVPGLICACVLNASHQPPELREISDILVGSNEARVCPPCPCGADVNSVLANLPGASTTTRLSDPISELEPGNVTGPSS